ncbi:MAG: glycosyltransferase family 39 protein [Candidatus Eisenbacteria bacterium]|nr:glycosyltransferase family 39 protein [Candidatus Eisenbacteria bacterium]
MKPDSPTDPQRLRPAHRAALGAILVAGAVARVFESGRAPMWFDEIYTTWAARGGAAAVIARMARDVHPPLHTLLVAGWEALGGESTPWLRSLSVGFGLATIVAVFLLGRAAFGARAGLVAAALLAVHPVHVYFSQEARVYALFWLELTAAWWLAWRWLSAGGARYAAGYVVAATLALYTHYLSGLILAFTGLAGLLLAWRTDGTRRRALGWIGLHLVVAALFLPQLPTFLRQNARLEADHWTGPPDARDLRDWLRHASGSVTYLIPVFLALGALAFRRAADRRPAAFLAFVGVAPVLAAYWLGTRGAHVFTARYMYYAVPPLLAVAAAGLVSLADLARDRSAPVRLAPWLLFVGLLGMETRSIALRGPYGEAADLASANRLLRGSVRPGDIVFCADTHALLFLVHHEPRLARIQLLWFDAKFPYYEGALVIADSLRVGPAAFGEPRPAGSRWWGVRVRHGGRNGTEAAALFDSAAAGRSRHFGSVTVWGPEAGGAPTP